MVNNWFIEDAMFSGMYSSDISKVFAYLKQNGVKGTNAIYRSNEIFVPLVTIDGSFPKLKIGQLLKVLKFLDRSMNWVVRQFTIGNKMGYGFDEFIKYITTWRFYPVKVLINIQPSELRLDDKVCTYIFDHPTYLFHVTDRSNIRKILSTGLIPKDSKSGIKYPPYVHLMRYLGGNILKCENNRLVPLKSLGLNDPVLLKVGPIDQLLNNTFMIDPNSMEDSLVAFNSIHPSLISIVDPEEYDRYFKEYNISQSKENIKVGRFSDTYYLGYPNTITK